MRKLFTLCIFILSILNSHAQAPNGINYQAVVRNALGTPLLGQPVGFRFNIRVGSATGSIAYAETHSVTTDPLGSIALVIGQGTLVSGSFANIPWSSGTYFNEVLIDVTGGTNYVSMGASQLWTVPYAFHADTAGYAPEHQTLSLSGNILGISGGNSVSLPGSSGTLGLSTQTVGVGIGYTLTSAVSEPGVDSFVVVANWNSGGLNQGGAINVKRDPLTGLYELGSVLAQEGPCVGSGVAVHSATTHQGIVFYCYTNFCDSKKIKSNLGNGNLTINVLPTNTNGIIFSDGQYLFINNNSQNFYYYSVSGNTLTFMGILALNTSSCPVMTDGHFYYSICGNTLSKYSLSGTLITTKSVSNSIGLVDIDATKLFTVAASWSLASPTPTYNAGITLNPISKP